MKTFKIMDWSGMCLPLPLNLSLVVLVFFLTGNVFGQQAVRWDERDTPLFFFPLQAKDFIKVSSTYGYRKHPIDRKMRWHHGIDLMAKKGSPVYAVEKGVVESEGYYGGYGNKVVIEHYPTKARTLYAHLWSITVKKGQSVAMGQLIGWVGDTGNVTGPHLHFEIWVNQLRTDPFVLWRHPSLMKQIKS